MVERLTRKRKIEEQENEPEEEGGDENEVRDGETENQAVDRVIANYKDKIRSPSTAIRAFCVTCMGGYVRMVAKCTAPQCPLYQFRFGTNPMHGRVGQKNPNAGKKLRVTRKR